MKQLSVLALLAFCSPVAAQTPPSTTAGDTIAIVSPSDGSVYRAPANIKVSVQGMDLPNRGHVIRLLVDDKAVQSVVLDPLAPPQTAPVHFNFDFTANKVRAGAHVLTAQIDDVTSAPIDVKVKRARSNKR